MSDTKFTPGPWKVFIDDAGGRWTGWPLSISSANDEDKTIVRTGGQWPYEWDASTSQREAVANAHLIAAAPDLYAALEHCLGTLTGGMDGIWDHHAPKPADLARAALAKARGQ